MDTKAVYGIKVIRSEVICSIKPPPPPTFFEIACARLRRSMFLGIVSIVGAACVTLAPVQTISAFLVSFFFTLAFSRSGR